MHELLIIDGEHTSMAFCPPIPTGNPRIHDSWADPPQSPPPSKDPEHPRHRDADSLNHSACWRGYEGTWEIKDGRFYLVGVRGRFQLLDGPPIFADWFSGVLRVPVGRQLTYIHMGFGSVYERELHIKIEQGVVVKTRTLDNRGRNHDDEELRWSNLPGGENRFPGDDEF